jgi:hypothetical protein
MGVAEGMRVGEGVTELIGTAVGVASMTLVAVGLGVSAKVKLVSGLVSGGRLVITKKNAPVSAITAVAALTTLIAGNIDNHMLTPSSRLAHCDAPPPGGCQ